MQEVERVEWAPHLPYYAKVLVWGCISDCAVSGPKKAIHPYPHSGSVLESIGVVAGHFLSRRASFFATYGPCQSIN